uniref:Estradiol 17-beta-dehydrogenase 11 n=1 Tax=Ascaris lumbricoides TaxID=6252 RepID=A0A0M3IJA8_ASCLU
MEATAIDALQKVGLLLRIFAFTTYSLGKALFRHLEPQILCRKESVKGLRVLITGAANGLGRQLAVRFAKKNSKLILWDIDEIALEKCASECKESGCEEVYSDRVDMAFRESIHEAAEKVNRKYGGVDIIVSNAGVLNGGYFMELDDAKLDRIVDINFKAHFWIMKSFLGGMIERNSGHIVPICSMASFVAAPKLVDYASTKYALLGFMEGLQNEMKYMRKDGIQFTIVCPHWINTRLIRQLGYLIYESGNLLRPIIYYHKTSCRKTNTNSRFSFCSIRAIEIFRKQFIHVLWQMIFL